MHEGILKGNFDVPRSSSSSAHTLVTRANLTKMPSVKCALLAVGGPRTNEEQH
jgi:hypothetical protein